MKRNFASLYFTDSQLWPYICLYAMFWGNSLGVKWPEHEAGHPIITIFPLNVIMASTGQLDPVAIMTVRERGLGNIFRYLRK